jgi:hypothetical protein
MHTCPEIRTIQTDTRPVRADQTSIDVCGSDQSKDRSSDRPEDQSRDQTEDRSDVDTNSKGWTLEQIDRSRSVPSFGLPKWNGWI